MAHLTLDELPGFLRALDLNNGSPVTKGCCLLALLTANRPGVTRTLRLDELDLDDALWTMPKGRDGMKRGYAHLTPLAHRPKSPPPDTIAASSRSSTRTSTRG